MSKSKLEIYYYADGIVRDIIGRTKSISIGGDTSKAYRTCSLSINNTVGGRKYSIPFKNGAEIRVRYDGTEIFRGIIFSKSLDSDGSQSLTVHDPNVYLTKNSDTVRFTNSTASQIIRTLCNNYGIKFGEIADTRYVIPRFIVRGKSLYDIIVTALTETQKNTGIRYRILNREGRLELIQVGKQVEKLVIENGRNIMSASFNESIEDLKTRVKLTGGDEDKPVTVEVSSNKSKSYGIMQHYEHNSDVKSAKELRPLADTLLRDLSKPKQDFNVDAIGDINVISAKTVEVSEEMTGIKGQFYVSADSHNFDEDNVHTMSLTLSRELELTEMDYDDPSEEN